MGTGNTPPRNGRQTVLISIVLATVTLAAYWPVRLNEFVQYDDPDYVTANPHVRAGLTWDGVAWAFQSSHSANWHPITWLSHMLDCQLFGLNPTGHHLSNLLFHILNTVLLFLVVRRMTGAIWRSALVAALFALHPLHVESVAWVSERKDLLSTGFGLLCLQAYVRHVEQSKVPVRGLTGSYLPALLFFALGLMSKPMLVTLPFLLLLLDYWPLQRFSPATFVSQPSIVLPLLREKLPFLALAAGSCAVTLLAQQQAMLYHKELTFSDRAANAVIAYARYLGKSVWPLDLAAPYPHPAAWPVFSVAASAVLLLVLSALALRNWKRRPYLLVGWLWFVGMLVPVIGLVQVGVAAMADRYTYLPLVGIFLMLAWAGAEWMSRCRTPALAGALAAAALLIASGVCTWFQVQVWRDTETLFTHATALTRNNWVAHYNLALLALDRYQTLQRASLESQRVQFSSLPPTTAGGVSPARDYLEEVIFHCRAALEGRPGFADIHVTVAKALTERGELDAARAHLETVVRVDARNAEARQNLAEILHRQGRASAAMAQYEVALQLRPEWEAVLNNLAWLLATHPDPEIRNGPEAVRLAERACGLTSHTNYWHLQTLAAAYAETRQFTNAAQTSLRARELAMEAGLPDLVSLAERRLRLYQGGRPFRE